eukprot:scaffold2516_cov242-Pinguiococcus_pyrenoidosus.AAC.3
MSTRTGRTGYQTGFLPLARLPTALVRDRSPFLLLRGKRATTEAPFLLLLLLLLLPSPWLERGSGAAGRGGALESSTSAGVVNLIQQRTQGMKGRSRRKAGVVIFHQPVSLTWLMRMQNRTEV